MNPYKYSKRQPTGGSVTIAERARTAAVFPGPKRISPKTLGDRLRQLSLAWAWNSGHPSWVSAVRTLARVLRGLAAEGLIERQRTRSTDGQVLHLVRLTPLGKVALRLLNGNDRGCRS